MRCAALRLPWFGWRCGGVVGRVTPGGCKGDVSWSQDRYQPARNSILAAGSDPKRCVCEIPLSAHSPQNLGHFPTAVKVQQTKSSVRLCAHSVATKCVSCCASRGALIFSLLLMVFEHCLAMLILCIIAERLDLLSEIRGMK